MDTDLFTEQLMLKNYFYRHAKCRSAFCKFFLFCIEKAQSSKEPELMQNFATEAELALQVYSEKAWLWKKDIDLLRDYRQSLNNLYKEIDELSIKKQKELEQKQNKILEDESNLRQQNNNVVLKQIQDLQKEINAVSTFDELNTYITHLENLELLLDKDIFTPEQSESYRSISSAYTELTSEKMRVFQHEADVKYNMLAAEICKKSFDEFKKNAKQYKVIDYNFKAVFGEFYSIESSRLFVETQMLYSHVYSFIFSKLSDDEKFKLVSFALEIKK